MAPEGRNTTTKVDEIKDTVVWTCH